LAAGEARVLPSTSAATLDYYAPAIFSGRIRYAGFWPRVGAAFIDGILLWFVQMIVGFALGILLGRSQAPIGLLLQVFSISLDWLYSALMESSVFQATLGKLVLGIRVTNLSGQRITFGHASGRHFGKFLSAITLGIGYLMAGFTEQKQALHDLVASTLVIKS
jgi:uncharacterized RDD family membrane protein YckC